MPTEHGLKLDAEATLNYISNRHDIDQNKIYVFGRSLGGAVAIQACLNTEFNIQGLIVENTFSSISDMVDLLFPLLSVFKSQI